jgi:hypothetical protein
MWRLRSFGVFSLALGLELVAIVSATSVANLPRHEHHDEPQGPYEFNFTNEEVSNELQLAAESPRLFREPKK